MIRHTPQVPELLAPAGDWEAMRAAVANGADAVYFGTSGFNARHRAANFSVDELPSVIEFLHAHNVRGYITVNVLIFSDELEEAQRLIVAIARAGADAVIVQDLGLATLIARICPTLPIHGSTQMTLTEPAGIEFVSQLGASRVILARELSLADIGAIRSATDVPLEVFVHGALCVAYSGQCLTSEAMGGRSANRGQCAQACRLPYTLIVDRIERPLGDRAYLLSPQDLAAHDLIGELASLGVGCVKIEGRLKSAQYVAATTQAYRAAIDAAAAGRKFAISSQQSADLAQSFSRGFTHGFLDGVDHQALVHARFPKKRGIRVGRVIDIDADALIVKLEPDVTVKNGDGVVMDEGHPEQEELGGRIFSTRQIGRSGQPGRTGSPAMVELRFGRDGLNTSDVAVGAIVWKTDDPEIRKRLTHSYSRPVTPRRVRLSLDARAAAGQPMQVTLRDDAGNIGEATGPNPLEAALRRPLSATVLREQLGRLGDTPFELGDVSLNGDAANDASAPVMVPKSVLNELRRQAVAQLLEQRKSAGRFATIDLAALTPMREQIARRTAARPDSPKSPNLYVLARSMEQLQAVLDWSAASDDISRAAMVYCEFEDIRGYPQAVSLARGAGMPIALATIRIVKPNEQGLLKRVADAQPDAVLIRNLGGLAYFSQQHLQLPLIADYALNIANELTADLLLQRGVIRLTPSYDLNWTQYQALISRCGAGVMEAVIHQQMPMFHMEHCVFAHTLSNGKDYRDCGRPCEKHQVELRDRAGLSHPLLADVGCRNTVYNGVAQSAAEYAPAMQKLGIVHFRVELLRQPASEVGPLLDRYARVLSGQDDGRAAWRELKVLNQLGVTRGTLEG